MALPSPVREATRAQIDAAFQNVFIRSPLSKLPRDFGDLFGGRDHVTVTYSSSISSFMRNRSYHEWNMGSWDAKPTTEELVKLLTFLKTTADARWGAKPLRASISDICPFVNEFKDSGFLVQELVDAVNAVYGAGTAAVLQRPTDIVLPAFNADGVRVGETKLFNVRAHTLPFERVEV